MIDPASAARHLSVKFNEAWDNTVGKPVITLVDEIDANDDPVTTIKVTTVNGTSPVLTINKDLLATGFSTTLDLDVEADFYSAVDQLVEAVDLDL